MHLPNKVSVMQQIILTTPNELRQFISEIVKDEFTEYLKAHNNSAPTPQPQTDFLTRQQAANVLGVSLPTLNEWSKSGVIIGYRIASRVRYKRHEIEQSLLQMQTKKTRRAA